MVRRHRPRRKRIAEQRANYQTNPDPPLPPFASTPDEIQRAVERNSIKRGLFNYQELGGT